MSPNPFFQFGVAYYPDYLHAGERTRTASGRIAALPIKDRLRTDYERMQKNGIGMVRVGEFSWAHVEPRPGELYTERFTLALELAQEFGIQVMFCTPTATPPKWLVERDPSILPVTRAGKTIPFGGRRHYDVVSPSFRRESRRITEIYAKAFGGHPAVTAWQTDNELGNHTSSRTFSPAARDGFRAWLDRRYAGDIAKLNEEWFNCFWSFHYNSFAEIELPVETWNDPNPALELEYRRFMSHAYREFQAEQLAIIRAHSPGRPVTHNITPMFFDICLWDLCADLDVAGYDHYQMGPKANPLSSASQYNLMRSLKAGRKFLVLEQQPVQVNWQPVNARHGIDWLFLWGFQSAFLGASMMMYFSWQRFAGGSEQYHDGVVPHDLRLPESRQEKVIKAKGQVCRALADKFGLAALPSPQADVLIINSFESLWTHEICSQTVLWDGIKIIEELQRPFLASGIGVDMAPSIAAAATRLHTYKLLILPGYAFEFSASEKAALRQFIADGGSVLSLPRTAMKDTINRLVPLPLAIYADDDFYFDEYGALLAEESETVALPDGASLTGRIWAEKLVLQNHERWEVLGVFQGGLYADAPAIVKTRAGAFGGKGVGCHVHLAFCPEMSKDFSVFVRNTFQLHPRLQADESACVQTFSFVEGARRFVAAINFEPTSQTLHMPRTTTAKAGMLNEYRAHLTASLSVVESHATVPLSTASTTALHLGAREIAMWEVLSAT